MDFEVDTFHLEILTRGEKSAEMDERTIDRLADEHLEYRFRLRREGLLLTAGAVLGAQASRNVETGRPIVGLGFWNLARDEALRLISGDPGVRAGLYLAELVQFMCPKGAITFKEP